MKPIELHDELGHLCSYSSERRAFQVVSDLNLPIIGGSYKIINKLTNTAACVKPNNFKIKEKDIMSGCDKEGGCTCGSNPMKEANDALDKVLAERFEQPDYVTDTFSNEVVVKIKKLNPNATIPEYAKDGDACFDLHALDSIALQPDCWALIKTGLAYAISEGYEIQVRSRSGHAYNKGVTVLNSPGTIDAGYRGDLGVILINNGPEEFIINAGDRIAQAAIKPVYTAIFEEVSELDDTERGEGGFGHTGN